MFSQLIFNRNFSQLYILGLLIIFLASCNLNNAPKVKPLSNSEIKSFQEFEELGVQDYMRLIVSKELILSLHKNKDSSVPLLKDFATQDDPYPLIMIDGEKNFDEWMSVEDVAYLESLLGSNQPSFNIINSRSSRLVVYESEVGEEAKVFLSLYKKKRCFYSRNCE